MQCRRHGIENEIKIAMRLDKKYITAFLILFLISSHSLYGQNETDQFRLRIGVLTETITHPGLSLGCSSILKNKQKTVVKKKATLERNNELVLISKIGFYQHRANHTGILYSASIGQKRYIISRKLTHQYGLGFGGLTQVNSGVTYEIKDGDIEESNLKSRTYFHTFLFYEVGYPIKQSFRGYTRVQLGAKFPYNTYFSIVPIIETGVTIPLKLNTKKE